MDVKEEKSAMLIASASIAIGAWWITVALLRAIAIVNDGLSWSLLGIYQTAALSGMSLILAAILLLQKSPAAQLFFAIPFTIAIARWLINWKYVFPVKSFLLEQFDLEHIWSTQ